MQVHSFTNLPDFLAFANDFLYKYPLQNHLMYGIANRFDPEDRLPQDSYLIAIKEKGAVIFAAVQSPGEPIIINGAQKALLPFMNFIQEQSIDLHGISGPTELLEESVNLWHEGIGGSSNLFMDNLIYKLTKVKALKPPAGHFRLATASDRATLIQWSCGFDLEAFGPSEVNREKAALRVDSKLNRQQLYVWEEEDIVSMAGWARPSKLGIAINYVYTPKAFRRKGYARGLVAALSEHMLEKGYPFCTLFTDRQNSTSNKIYQEIGYECFGGFQYYVFSKP